MQDYQTALNVLVQHWEIRITEEDFIAIAAADSRISGESIVFPSSTQVSTHEISLLGDPKSIMGFASLSGIGLFQVILPSHHISPGRGRTSSAR